MTTQPSNKMTTHMGRGMIYAAWILLLFILTIAFNNYLENQRNPNQNVSVTVNESGTAEVILTRNQAGHYVANGFINGSHVTFLLDTGATLVSIPEPLARKLNLTRGVPHSVYTANGTTTVFSTRLDNVQLGAIRLDNVKASINPGMGGNEALLGMSFMKHLEMIQRGNQLILRLPGSGVY